MTTVGDPTRLDDLYSAIVARIEANDLEGALTLYNSAEKAGQKPDLVLRVHQSVMEIVDLALSLDRLLDLDLDFDFTPVFRLVRSRAYDLDLHFTLARDLDRYLTLARTRDLDVIISVITSAQRLNQFIVAALGGEITRVLIFDDIELLTVRALNDDLIPYLQTLCDLEQLLVEAKGETFHEPKIKSISQHSPVRVEIAGLTEVIKAIRNVLSVYWQEKAEEFADIELENQRNAFDSGTIQKERDEIHRRREKLELEKLTRDIYRSSVPMLRVTTEQIERAFPHIKAILAHPAPVLPEM